MQIQQSKPGYKLVITFFGKKIEIPEEWEWTRVEKQFKLKSGSTPARSHPEYYDGNIPWVTSGELDYNVITDTKEHVSSIAVHKTKLRMYPKRTFLIAITGLEAKGTRGRCAILDVEATTNQSCLAFYESPTVDPFFFYYYYRYNGEKIISSLAQGTKQQSLNIGLVKSIKFPLPSLQEQQKIALILSNIDSQINQTQKIIELTQKLKKGMMQKLLTKGIGHNKFKLFTIGPRYIHENIPTEWEIVSLQSMVTQSISYGVVVPEEDPNGVPMIRSGQIDLPRGIEKNLILISKQLEEQFQKTRLIGGEILMALVGATIGRLTVAPQFCKGYNVSRALAVIRLKDDYIPEFYAYFMKSDLVQKKIKIMTAGSAQPVINLAEISKFKFPVPPKHEQQKIVSILLNIELKINETLHYKSNLENLKKGLMQKLLTGQIRVKV